MRSISAAPAFLTNRLVVSLNLDDRDHKIYEKCGLFSQISSIGELKTQMNNQKKHPFVSKYLTPFQRKLLEKSLQSESREKYRQRIQIMLLVDEGKKQGEICRLLGCCPATASRWIHLAKMGQAHRWKDNRIGRPKVVDEEILGRLKELVSHSPGDYDYPFKRWTAAWLSKHLVKEFGQTVSDRRINQLLKEMGLSTRPQSALTEENQHNNSNNNRLAIADLGNTTESEVHPFWSFSLLEKK